MPTHTLKKRLGDLLVESGVITAGQLSAALNIQKRFGGKLGAILEQTGAVKGEVLLAFLGKQCGASYVSLIEYGDIPAAVIRTVPETLARSQNLIPIALDNAVLTVAMSDPFNVFALDDIKIMTGYELQVVISAEADIAAAIERHYSHTETGPQAQLMPSELPATDISPEQENDFFNAFLSGILNANAAIVYLDPQADAVRVRCRLDGFLQEKSPIRKQVMEKILPRLKVMAHLASKNDGEPCEGRIRTRIDDRDRDIHVTFVPTIFGERVVLRISDPALFQLKLSELGFEAEGLGVYRKAVESTRGLVLITGPLGSGKTTTLYSTLYHLNTPNRDIVTIENPVEHVIPGITQVQMNPGSSDKLADDLQMFLVQDPDVVMITELSDKEITRSACKAALGGHVVLSTLTAASALDAVRQLISAGIDPFLIASSLKLIVNQRLIRLSCPHCKESYTIPLAGLQGLGLDNATLFDDTELTLMRGTGCDHCSQTGYHGRTAIYELLEMNDALRAYILSGARDAVLQEGVRPSPAMTLREALWRRVHIGDTTAEEMLRILKN